MQLIIPEFLSVTIGLAVFLLGASITGVGNVITNEVMIGRAQIAAATPIGQLLR